MNLVASSPSGLDSRPRITPAAECALAGSPRPGTRALRSVLNFGGTASSRHIRAGRHKLGPWSAALLERKPPKLPTEALPDRFPHIARRRMVSGGIYNRPPEGCRHDRGLARGADQLTEREPPDCRRQELAAHPPIRELPMVARVSPMPPMGPERAWRRPSGPASVARVNSA